MQELEGARSTREERIGGWTSVSERMMKARERGHDTKIMDKTAGRREDGGSEGGGVGTKGRISR